jgi:RNA polymerase sigma-54 factor
MALGPRLDLRQSQSLVMTPQLQQAIRLLALSNLEVEAFIAEEIEKNPLLEADRDDAPDLDAPSLSEERRETSEALLDDSPGGGDPALDVDLTAETFHHDSAADGGPGMDGRLGLTGDSGGAGFDEGPDFDAMEADAPSLRDHLLAQAGAQLSGVDLLIASHLIDQIDEAGYLTQPLLELANRLAVPLVQVEAALGASTPWTPPASVPGRSVSVSPCKHTKWTGSTPRWRACSIILSFSQKAVSRS